MRTYWTSALGVRTLSKEISTPGEGNRPSPLGRLRQFVVVALVGVTLLCAPTAGSAYQILQQAQQPQAIDPATGRITVEASIIHVVACNGAGENGGQFYIYQYVNRPGFRAVRPPIWVGIGPDQPTFAHAVAVACGLGAVPTGSLMGHWQVKCCNESLSWTLSITEQRGNSFSGHFSPGHGGGTVTHGHVLGNTISFVRSDSWGTQYWSAQLVNDRGTLKMMQGVWTGDYLNQYQGRNNWHAEKH
jgi:hypothetical protein